MADAIPRCGDHVLHRPSGEQWVVAWAEGDDLAPAGWPNSVARLADCEVTHRCTDEEHRSWVAEWRDLKDGDSRRARVLRLYAEPPAAQQEATPERRAAACIAQVLRAVTQTPDDLGRAAVEAISAAGLVILPAERASALLEAERRG